MQHQIIRNEIRSETLRKILREAEMRFDHELLGDEERQLLLDRIRRLRRRLSA